MEPPPLYLFEVEEHSVQKGVCRVCCISVYAVCAVYPGTRGRIAGLICLRNHFATLPTYVAPSCAIVQGSSCKESDRGAASEADWTVGDEYTAVACLAAPCSSVMFVCFVFPAGRAPPTRGGIGRQYPQEPLPLPCLLGDSLVMGVLKPLPTGAPGLGRVGALVLRSADAASGLPPRPRSPLFLGWALLGTLDRAFQGAR